MCGLERSEQAGDYGHTGIETDRERGDEAKTITQAEAPSPKIKFPFIFFGGDMVIFRGRGHEKKVVFRMIHGKGFRSYQGAIRLGFFKKQKKPGSQRPPELLITNPDSNNGLFEKNYELNCL